MQNGPFDALPPSPFARLRGLLDGVEPSKAPLSLALGEPQHAPPHFVTQAGASRRRRLWPLSADWRHAALARRGGRLADKTFCAGHGFAG